MKTVFKKFSERILFIALAIFFIFCFYQFRLIGKSGEEWKRVFTSDSEGYYAYLPAIFIYENLDQQHYHQGFNFITENNKIVNKYYIGTSLLESPFFFIATVHSKIVGASVDGFNFYYSFWVGLAPIFYVMLSLVYLYRMVLYFSKNKLFSIALIIFTAIGTNLFYYTVYKGNFSHAFSFSFMVFYLWNLFIIYKDGFSVKRLAGLLICLMIIFLIRPVNIICILLLPVFYTSFAEFHKNFISVIFKYKTIVLSFAIVVFFIFLQMMVWKIQTGNWIVWSYNQEGFYFDNPRVIEQLFGWDGGIMIYNPVMAIFIFSVFFLLKNKKLNTVVLIAFSILMFYVLSCWWAVTYGYTFGIRPYIDFTAVFVVAFSVLNLRNKFIYSSLILLMILGLAGNLLFSYQNYFDILPAQGMNAQKFKQIFFKTNQKYSVCFGGSFNPLPYAPNGYLVVYKYDFKKTSDVNAEFPVSTEFTFPSKYNHIRNVHCTFNIDYFIPFNGSMNEVLLVFHVLDSLNNTIDYYTFPLKEYKFEKPGLTRKVNYTVDYPNVINGNSIVKIYIWNPKNEKFNINKFKLITVVPKF